MSASEISPEHLEMLAAARGYETITDVARLAELKIVKTAQTVPGLLVPQLRGDDSDRAMTAAATRFMPGVDYRGIGGYVVAPPSTLGPPGRAWSWAHYPSAVITGVGDHHAG